MQLCYFESLNEGVLFLRKREKADGLLLAVLLYQRAAGHIYIIVTLR